MGGGNTISLHMVPDNIEREHFSSGNQLVNACFDRTQTNPWASLVIPLSLLPHLFQCSMGVKIQKHRGVSGNIGNLETTWSNNEIETPLKDKQTTN